MTINDLLNETKQLVDEADAMHGKGVQAYQGHIPKIEAAIDKANDFIDNTVISPDRRRVHIARADLHYALTKMYRLSGQSDRALKAASEGLCYDNEVTLQYDKVLEYIGSRPVKGDGNDPFFAAKILEEAALTYRSRENGLGMAICVAELAQEYYSMSSYDKQWEFARITGIIASIQLDKYYTTKDKSSLDLAVKNSDIEYDYFKTLNIDMMTLTPENRKQIGGWANANLNSGSILTAAAMEDKFRSLSVEFLIRLMRAARNYELIGHKAGILITQIDMLNGLSRYPSEYSAGGWMCPNPSHRAEMKLELMDSILENQDTIRKWDKGIVRTGAALYGIIKYLEDSPQKREFKEFVDKTFGLKQLEEKYGWI